MIGKKSREEYFVSHDNYEIQRSASVGKAWLEHYPSFTEGLWLLLCLHSSLWQVLQSLTGPVKPKVLATWPSMEKIPSSLEAFAGLNSSLWTISKI